MQYNSSHWLNRTFVSIALAGVISVNFCFHIANAEPKIAELLSRGINTNRFINFQLERTLQGHSGAIKSLTFSPNSKVLISAGTHNEGRILLWNTRTGKPTGTIRKADQTAVQSLVVSSDGKTLVSGGSDSRINHMKYEESSVLP